MISLLSMLLFTAPPANAQDLKKPEFQVKVRPYDLQVQALTFPSGLRVILQRDEAANYLSVVSVHSGGSLLDPEGKQGTYAVAERLFYRAKMGNGTVRDQLYAVGADYAAQSIQDWVIYRATGPTSALSTFLQAEGIRLDDMLEGQTDEQLQNELVLMDLEPFYAGDRWGWGSAWDVIFEMAHPDDKPYGVLKQGAYLAEYRNTTLEDVRAYADQAFAPGNTTMVISGAIDFDDTIASLMVNLPPQVLHPDATEENLRTFFKANVVNPDPDNPDHKTSWLADPETDELIDLTDKPVERITWEEPEPWPVDPTYDGRVIHVQGLVDTPIAVVAWAVPGPWVGNDAITGIGATAIGTAGYSSWASTFEIAKGNDGGPQAGCSGYVALHSGHIVCTATARDARVNANELTDKLKAPSSLFWDPNATWLHEQATEGGRQNALGHQLHQLENYANLTDGLASRTALNAHFYGDPRYASILMQDTMSLERSTVRPWVQEWLKEARAVSVVVDPLPLEKRLEIPRETMYHASIGGHDIPEADVVPTNEDVAAAYRGPDLSKAVEKTLSGGLKVVVIPHGSIPIVTSLLVSRGGVAYGDGIDTLSEITMRRIWDEIYEDATGRKQEMLPQKIAAQSVFDRTLDVTYEGFAAPTDNLDAALYLLRRNEMARKVNLAGRSNWWKATRLELPRAWDNRSFWAQQARVNRILVDHPVKWTMSQEDARRLKEEVTSAELGSWYDNKFNVDNSVLVMVGAVDPEDALKLAETYWGSWDKKAPQKLAEMPGRPTPKGAATLFLDADGADHTIVAASCPLPVPTAEVSAAQQVMSNAMEEALNAELEKAGASALASKAIANEGAGVAWLDLYTIVPHSEAKSAVEAINAALAIPEAGGFEQDRLQQFKLRIAGKEVFRQIGTRDLAKAVGEVYVQAFKGKDWFDRWGKALAEVDVDAIKAATEGCAANAVVTIESPSEGLAEMTEAFEAKRVDWQKKSDAQLETWDKKAYKRRLKQRAKAGN